MKLDISAAWNEAVAMIGANREVLAILAGIFFFLPGLAVDLFLPPRPTPVEGANLEQTLAVLRDFWLAAAPYVLLSMLLQLLGQLAITRLIGLRAGGTVGEALREGAAGLPIVLLAQLILGLGWGLAGGMLVGVAAAAHLPAVAALLGAALVGVAIWAGARLALIVPLVGIERMRNPLAVLQRSWALTRGSAGPILLFLVLMVVVMIVASLGIGAVGGLLATVLLGAKSAEVVSGVLSALLSAVFTLYLTAAFTAFYRQLSGQAAAN